VGKVERLRFFSASHENERVRTVGVDREVVGKERVRAIGNERARATKAFEEFFFARAREVYPRYDFARMNDNEFGATLELN
jgi:hypothetical protein